ncbi:cytochrome P450 / NADPH-cytochrome P450 reductase [Actinopolymorpha cephalotaxi]|uniref:Bifunctional cytochrome P450/NADPH--P450 reductase n=1 Tax=Actinopolymorpha cephalotaxi TaxID=504797 RepID=A0A1I2LPK3_9ACTN|nr:cytochrome P450 [Actinopolymorpha cephalotaxi]NYH81354.1 cytochrome P450/NADPH-cytochrome P450 reductase [Actinopolymorpha cephalotaxi]SFF80359.1 cytochrome P450 / NADPH-cytochrome P450 reductase [Actinopolymorpha cephalotaxi]
MADLLPIPGPRGVPVLGNTFQVPADGPSAHFAALAREYPEGIFRLELAGRQVIFVHDPDLVAEVCDESRFHKPIDPPLSHVRDFAGDGLFTARSDEPSWGQAHRILMPAFGQRSMKAYFPQMLEVAEQLVGKWQHRQGADLNMAEDMTRLALDTISLTGFGHRFNSFDAEELHPFLQAMGNALVEAMTRMRQLPFVTSMRRGQDRAYRDDIQTMQNLVDEVIRERRAEGRTGGSDLLGLMLDAADPVTGERLSDENIRNQVLTFLIAGHETTSGLLSFALYLLLRNPHVLAQAYAEVDRLLPGDSLPTYETVMKLDVIPRILDETLRLWSPIPGIGLTAYEDTVLGGRYPVAKGQKISVLLAPLHTHPGAWERPEEFDIDRWLPERKAEHHPHAYKPFGNGERACIGRQFALTEARLALALLLRRFALSDPHSYRMHVKQTLTIKPEGFTVRVRERRPHERAVPVAAAEDSGEAGAAAASSTLDVRAVGVSLRVAYGSNLGSTEDLAHVVAERARQSGFETTLCTLDELAGDVPADGLLVAVTASYNGKAPDNAQRFDHLLDGGGLAPGSLAGLKFAVLGAGNTQWATYQAFPRRVEAGLLAAGATAVVPRGEADAAGDFDGMAEAWLGELWTALAREYGADTSAAAGPRYRLEVLTEADIRPSVVSEQAVPLTVVSSEDLVADATGLWDFALEAPRPAARSVVLELPEGVTYRTGNHLAVFAKNDPELVAWAMRQLRVRPDQVVRLSQEDGRRTHLPVGVPVPVELLLTEFVELQEVATRAQLRTLLGHTGCPWTTREIEGLCGEEPEAQQRYADEILAKRVSVLGLLERFPAVELPLAAFLELAGPIRPRFYSISSSPAVDPRRPRLTVGLVEGPAWAGTGEYRGLCSQYLARLEPGDVVYGYVRTPAPAFEPPADPATPMVLVGPGTGIAPLRGFVEERATLSAAGERVGPALLFYGCRHPEHDWLYGAEFAEWERSGVVTVHAAYSAVPGHPYRFVQDAVLAQGDAVWAALADGGHFYVCGDGARMAPAVRAALLEIFRRNAGGSGVDAEEWLAGLERDGRYQQDVFA